MKRAALLACSVAVALVALSCSSPSEPVAQRESAPRPDSSAVGPAPDEPDPSAPGTVAWDGCRDELLTMAALECGTLEVPIDPADPDGGTVELALARQPSTGAPSERIGSLVLNPGGPGGSGLEFLANTAGAFPEELTDRFDLVSFDPRGVGASDPVRCLDDEQKDAQLEGDLSPDTPEERARAQADVEEFRTGCEERNPDLVEHMSTADVAADLDAIRAAVGDDQLTYMGFSYGTSIGATYATLFPGNVRALVLDGSVSPEPDREAKALVQAAGFEKVFANFVAACNAEPDCALAPDAAAAVESARASLETDPVEVTDATGTRTLGPDQFVFGLATALYDESTWSATAQAVADLRDGGAETLLSLVDRQTGRQPDGTYDNATDARTMVNCADANERPSTEEALAAEQRIVAAAPIFGPLTGTGLDSCTDWPEAANPTPRPTGTGAGPILVVGTLGDPATPYEWAQQMAAALEGGALLTYEGDGHTAFFTGGACVQDAVVTYLVDLTLPPDGTSCPSDTSSTAFGDVRDTVVRGLVDSGVPEEVAECVVDGMIDEVGQARFDQIILQQDQEEITKLAAAQALECATGGD